MKSQNNDNIKYSVTTIQAGEFYISIHSQKQYNHYTKESRMYVTLVTRSGGNQPRVVLRGRTTVGLVTEVNGKEFCELIESCGVTNKKVKFCKQQTTKQFNKTRKKEILPILKSVKHAMSL